ncbi:STAS domain-containing protein [Shewanella aestuarii]|uniref:STAS domain-containing protein n=1 Tax=Shewanella aestuarii TaxID=1028752 RepID=UPI00329A1287
MDIYNIRLPNRFDFSHHKIFNQEIESLFKQSNVKEIHLDFSQVNYLDSSALGMLVLLSKKNEKLFGAKLSIKGAHGSAFEILEIAQMGRLYAFI